MRTRTTFTNTSHLGLMTEKIRPFQASIPIPSPRIPEHYVPRLTTGENRDRKIPDKPIMRPSQENKPEQRPDRNTPLKKFRQIAQKLPRCKSGSTEHRTQLVA